jgi:hypothetical protein
MAYALLLHARLSELPLNTTEDSKMATRTKSTPNRKKVVNSSRRVVAKADHTARPSARTTQKNRTATGKLMTKVRRAVRSVARKAA